MLCLVQVADPGHEIEGVPRAVAATVREADVQLMKVNLLSRNANLKPGGRGIVVPTGPNVASRRQEVRSANKTLPTVETPNKT